MYRWTRPEYWRTGPFYFTTLVLPALLAVGTATPDDPARVVNTSSFASELSKKIDYTTFKDGQSRKKAGAFQLYNDSKFVSALLESTLGVVAHGVAGQRAVLERVGTPLR